MEAINYQSIPSEDPEIDCEIDPQVDQIDPEIDEVDPEIGHVILQGYPKPPPTKGKRILLAIISCTILFIFYRWYFHPVDISHHFIFTLPSDIIPPTIINLNNSNSNNNDVTNNDLDNSNSNNNNNNNGNNDIEKEKGSISYDVFNRFIMKSYQNMKPMSNFLPGVGGKWGKWTYKP